MDENVNNPQQRGGCICGGAGPQVTSMFQNMWSQATSNHFRTSRVEFLKGIRSLIDHRIERLSRNPQQRGTTVPVE